MGGEVTSLFEWLMKMALIEATMYAWSLFKVVDGEVVDVRLGIWFVG